jgi:hypothetical protein
MKESYGEGLATHTDPSNPGDRPGRRAAFDGRACWPPRDRVMQARFAGQPAGARPKSRAIKRVVGRNGRKSVGRRLSAISFGYGDARLLMVLDCVVYDHGSAQLTGAHTTKARVAHDVAVDDSRPPGSASDLDHT